jgi:hypothetical protein
LPGERDYAPVEDIKIDCFNLVLLDLLTLVSAAVSAIGWNYGQQMQGRATVFVWSIAV